MEHAMADQPAVGQAPWRKALKEKALDAIRHARIDGGEDGTQQYILAKRALRKLGQQRISQELLY
eukprot:12936580-Prorocentrum_lima.AAC.1